ncbi:tRNA-specific adenosine deaminase 2-like [Octopus sinensis]|uniref:tRNA-specific adenosine deaminase 2-like n=1 Tax=Octopus sinensis TaxID=2607531 RepID=A0A7E6EI17_9MOLL|nr:tRNA-specific adenosine deaminase 2-like [Octopus sinensis]
MNIKVQMHNEFMLEAFKEAETSLFKNEVPIGCVLVQNSKIIARSHNMTNQTSNATRHAEFVAIDNVCLVFFGGYNDRFGGCGSVLDVVADNPDNLSALPEFVGGFMAERAIEILKVFYKNENQNAPPTKRIRKI